MVTAPAPLARSSWFVRPAARDWTCGPAPRDVADFHRTLPGHAPTPLAELPSLAAELGVRRLFVKDESARLGLPAFKILGASWGIHRALCDRFGSASPERLRALRPDVRLVTATDGNHGRAVAAMARLLGLPSDVFVPDGVHPAAVAAIKAEGAGVTEVAGPYDEAVRVAASAAASDPSALLIQDTAWPGYAQVPQWIVEGYSTLFAEIDEQLAAAEAGPAGLVAVPVGVGSLAQAAVTHYRSGQDAPTVLSVEPDVASCVLASLHNDRPLSVQTGATTMAGLNCATPSTLAWPVLRAGVDAAVAVTDASTARAARDLAALGVPAGPCGAASLAGVRAALAPDRRPFLAPGHRDTVVLLSTEGRAANPALGTFRG
ncbi:pyridoxal-phosphate dependent enzyme [Actinomadura darangshiensis]|uniref:Pyridoxal-phosphate dependent enzyme n=1 Tax=Actinomadura darangshiensis TaxID=705336 RepID=A0A4R5ATT9_9ACTN|nr:pyridoxal-phosphate dependent enzyme [Actinomadura darangshiensis]TDD74534.1 pyridoxal-phosphate dependent enzyme [Actinomadura darangshiensis]